MFELYNNTLCVKANWLDEAGVVTINALKLLAHRGKVKKARSGRGLGNYALYIYDSLPQRFRNIIEHDLGIDPYQEVKTISFARYLKYDETAAAFFSNYELEDGRFLSEVNEKAVNEYTANVCVFNAIKTLHGKITSANPRINKGELWKRFKNSIHALDNDIKKRYPFNLPTNPRALRAKYEACILEKANKRYKRTGLEGLIHDNYCNNNSSKITQDIGDWLIAVYSLSFSTSIYELWLQYNEVRIEKGWTMLSEGGIYNFLYTPENERIWYEAKYGKEEYLKKYGHTLSKDKSRLFPNAHWAIDGTKFDAVHYWDNTSKMGAVCKINVVMDVYSEKILGYSFSRTENHIDHFIAVRMAVNESEARPYLFTYDAQSAHRSQRMQELYGKLIAKGGQHYHHKVGRKSNPIEQAFNRLQSQVISKRWFSDGQGIKTKQLRSKGNMDVIEKFKGALPTFEELQKHWEIIVEEWNNRPRNKKTNKTRHEFFQQASKHTQKIDVLDRVSMFWLNETKPKKYYASGMPLTVAGQDYQYEVYDVDNQVDKDFLLKYTNTKLIVSYDPEYLDDYVALYKINENGDKVFVAYAQKKRRSVEVAMLQKEGEYEQVLKDIAVREEIRLKDKSSLEAIMKRAGISMEDHIDQQNNFEFQAKRAAYTSKEENLQSDSKSLFERISK